MAQKLSGLHAIFSHAGLYNLAQRLVGAEKARRRLVHDYFPDGGGYRLLDIGCGTAEILRHLPLDIDYSGFDASAAYIAEARRRFGKRGIFRAELVREAVLDELKPFDIVLAFGLLHHLDDEEAEMLFALAATALKPEGRLITIDPAYVAGQSRPARWMISQDRGRNVRTPAAYAELARNHFAEIEGTVRHDMLNIPYSHLILQCRKGSAPPRKRTHAETL